MQIFNAISNALTKSAMNTGKNMIVASSSTTTTINNNDDANDNVTTQHFYGKFINAAP